MQFTLENIGKIRSAKITIDGFTVLAGENCTGKSTIGKALFAIYNSFSHQDEKIRNYRREAITNRLWFPRHKASDISDIEERILSQKQITAEELRELLPDVETSLRPLDLDAIAERLNQVIAVTDDELRAVLLRTTLNAEFENQLLNVFTELPGSMRLQVGKHTVQVSCPFAAKIEYSGAIPQTLDDALYIDDIPEPSIHCSLPAGHKDSLWRALYNRCETNIVDEAIQEGVSDQISELLTSVCDGRLVRTAPHRFVYQTRGKEIAFVNVSSGLRMFVALKTLIQKGALKRGGLLIMDEPEVHLHPKWQIIFAEILVLLQRALNLRILLSTHSHYFISALKTYAQYHRIENPYRFYLLDGNEEGTVDAVDVTDDTEPIYKKLVAPLQTLENVEYPDD